MSQQVVEEEDAKVALDKTVVTNKLENIIAGEAPVEEETEKSSAPAESESERIIEEQRTYIKEIEEKFEGLYEKLTFFNLDPETPSIKVDQDIMREFARSVFGDRHYEKAYQMHGDISIRVASMSAKEILVYKEIIGSRKEEMPALENGSKSIALEDLIILRLLFQIRQVDTRKYEAPLEDMPWEAVMGIYTDRFGDMPDAGIAILHGLVDRYEALVNELSKGMFDPDFHKGAGLA